MAGNTACRNASKQPQTPQGVRAYVLCHQPDNSLGDALTLTTPPGYWALMFEEAKGIMDRGRKARKPVPPEIAFNNARLMVEAKLPQTSLSGASDGRD